jgi:hypothetical protein
LEIFMSLETLYNNAQSNTYVGTVRAKQSSTAPANTSTPLVNFLDGTKRNGIAADQFQTEFTRNAAGSYVAGGIPKHGGGELTRWTGKAYKIAFDGEGPTTLAKGYYTEQFRTARNGQLIHNYTPALAKHFTTLNQSARTRAVSSPSGAPTGL